MPEHQPSDDLLRRAAEARERITEAPPEEALVSERGRLVIDVREPDEFAQGHLDGAINLPLGRLSELAPASLPDTEAPLVTYCNGGNRGALGADALQELGFTDVLNLRGGLRGMQEQPGDGDAPHR